MVGGGEGVEARSKREPPAAAAGAGVGAGDEVAGDESNSDMMSCACDLAGAGAEGEVTGVASEEPKMSASRSCVDCRDCWGAPFDGPDGADMSSPMRSTTVSLSARVVPTFRLSLTVPMIVALISGGGMRSRTPILTSPMLSSVPNSTLRCWISSSRLVE